MLRSWAGTRYVGDDAYALRVARRGKGGRIGIWRKRRGGGFEFCMCRGRERGQGYTGGGGRKRAKVGEMHDNRDVAKLGLRCGDGRRGQHGKCRGRSRRRADDEIGLHYPHDCLQQPARGHNITSLRNTLKKIRR
jgi:hypothetical protein